jgi:hypothetical protein
MSNLRTPGTYDMHARLRDFDRDGIAAAVIFRGARKKVDPRTCWPN